MRCCVAGTRTELADVRVNEVVIKTSDVRVDGFGGADRVIVVAGGDDEVRLLGANELGHLLRSRALHAEVADHGKPGRGFPCRNPFDWRRLGARRRRERHGRLTRLFIGIRSLFAARTSAREEERDERERYGRTLRFHSWNPVCGHLAR